MGYRDDVIALMSQAGIHCCPSRPEQREGFGVVNIEAKRAGIPSVVFPVGALPELIEHRANGWICSEVSVAALVEGLRYYLESPERQRRAGENARASLAGFSRKLFAEKWWEIFAEL